MVCNICFLSIAVLVTGSPMNLVAARNGLTSVMLSWTAPISSTPPVAGFEVFYSLSGSDIVESGGTTPTTSFTVSNGLSPGNVYDFLWWPTVK